MSVSIEELMDSTNADDDEKGKLSIILIHAQSLVDLEIDGNNKGMSYESPKNIQDIKDRLVLEVATNFYLHPDGATKTVFNNMSSIDSIKNYIRTPSIG